MASFVKNCGNSKHKSSIDSEDGPKKNHSTQQVARNALNL
jgi:hypothetical protein